MDKQTILDKFKTHLSEDMRNVTPTVTLKETRIRWIKVEHGITDTGDYVWHFQNHHKARPMPRDMKRTFEIIITYLDEVLPREVEKVVLPPSSDWDVKLISVRAKGVVKLWSFSESEMEKPLERICNMLSDMIEKDNPRRDQL